MESEEENCCEKLCLELCLQPSRPFFFTCNYCDRKFTTSQALGGHQNKHKLERKRLREQLQYCGRHDSAAGSRTVEAKESSTAARTEAWWGSLLYASTTGVDDAAAGEIIDLSLKL